MAHCEVSEARLVDLDLGYGRCITKCMRAGFASKAQTRIALGSHANPHETMHALRSGIHAGCKPSHGEAPSTGTTIIACVYNGGVVLGADGRVSVGNYISNRASNKIAPLAGHVFLLRSGSAPDAQIVSDNGEGQPSHEVTICVQHDGDPHCPLCCVTQSATTSTTSSLNWGKLRAWRLWRGWSCRCAPACCMQ